VGKIQKTSKTLEMVKVKVKVGIKEYEGMNKEVAG